MVQKFIFAGIAALIGFLAVFYFVSLPVANAVRPSDFGLKEGDLISAIFSDDPDVYIINENGYKRLFLNPEIFKFYAHLGGFASVKLVTPEIRDSFPTSGFFRNCEDNDQKVFGTSVEGEDAGRLHWINKSGEQAVAEDSDFFKKVFCINRKEFNWYPRGAEFKALKEVPQYTRKEDPTPYVICHHPTDDFKSWQTIRVAAEALDAHFQHGDTKGACPTTLPTPPPPEPTPPIPTACTDYDGGFNYEVRSKGVGVYSGASTGGLVFGEDPNKDTPPRSEPSIYPNSIYYDHCMDSSRSNFINEAFCDGVKLEAISYECQYGCANGICKPAPFTTPTPTLMPTPTSTLYPTPTPATFITVLSPNGGEIWQKGATRLIKWNSSNVSKVYIKLRKGNDTYSGPEGVVTNIIPNTGGFEWAPPTTLPNGSNYFIRVIDGNYTGVLDDSDKPFSIVSTATVSYSPTPTPTFTPTPTPTYTYTPTPTSTVSPLPNTQKIRVTFPNGGEQWSIGNKYTITWDNPGYVKSVYVDLYKAGKYLSGLGGLGSYYNAPTSWVWDTTNTPNFTAGSDFKIRVRSDTDSSIYDESDNYFSVSGPNYPVTCTALKTNSITSRYFDSCSSSGYDNVCFNKYYGTYQGCTKNTRDECTTYNANASQNMLCTVLGVPVSSPTPSPAYTYTPAPTPTYTLTLTPTPAPTPIMISPNGGEILAIYSVSSLKWRAPSVGYQASLFAVDANNRSRVWHLFDTSSGYTGENTIPWNVAAISPTHGSLGMGNYFARVCQRLDGPLYVNCDESDGSFAIVPEITPTPTPTSTQTTSACVGGDGRVPGLPTCLMPENLAGTAWNEVDNTTGKVLNTAVCSVAVCGRNGEWRTWPSNQLLNGRYYSNGYPENSTYIQTPFNSAYWGQYYTNGVWQTGGGGIVQPGSSQIIYQTPTPTSTASVSFDNFSRNLAGATELSITRDLYRGTSGNDVKQLQALLMSQVGYPTDLLTGYFGPITQNAVKKLQEKLGIKPALGYFGELTRRALNAFMGY